MHAIIAYDVEAKRTEIFKKICQRYLAKIQNSVFEGELTKAQLMNIQLALSKEIKENEKVRIWITSKILTVIKLGYQDTVEEGIL